MQRDEKAALQRKSKEKGLEQANILVNNTDADGILSEVTRKLKNHPEFAERQRKNDVSPADRQIQRITQQKSSDAKNNISSPTNGGDH